MLNIRGLPLLGTCVCLLVTGLAEAQVPATRQVVLSVTDPRPVAKAVEELSDLYGYPITYEDPEILFADDIRDVTEQVRLDHATQPPTTQTRVLVPAGGSLHIDYDIQSRTGMPQSPLTALKRVVDGQTASARGGVFRVLDDGKLLHVVPLKVRNKDGTWTPRHSVLDTTITIADEPRSTAQMIHAICAAVTKQSQVPLLFASGPSFDNEHPIRGSHEETARAVLARTLESTGKRVVWQIFYGPDDHQKFLNLRVLPNSTVGNTAQPGIESEGP